MERGWAKRPAYPLRMQSRWQIVCVSDLILMDRSTSNQISLLSDSSADSALPQMNEIQVDQVMSCASKLTKLAANFPCPFFFSPTPKTKSPVMFVRYQTVGGNPNLRPSPELEPEEDERSLTPVARASCIWRLENEPTTKSQQTTGLLIFTAHH